MGAESVARPVVVELGTGARWSTSRADRNADVETRKTMALGRIFSAIGVALRNGATSFLEYYRNEHDPLTRDRLTGVWNRPQFERRRERLGANYSLLLIDIDDFKRINDGFGHSVGDVVLRAVGSVLRTDSGDRVFRVGGEEFAVLLADCSSDDATKVAERLCETVRGLEVIDGAPVTVSVGVAAASSEADDSHDDVYRRADRALYFSKWSGKNRVTAFEQLPVDAAAGKRAA